VVRRDPAERIKTRRAGHGGQTISGIRPPARARQELLKHEYSHEKAVADGVNVGNEIYVIETERTKQSATIKANQQVEKRERLSRKKRWETEDADEAYTATQLDRDIVNPDQIRTVIRTFRDKLPEIKAATGCEVLRCRGRR
jgi:type I site-specific restriction endonuclease